MGNISQSNNMNLTLNFEMIKKTSESFPFDNIYFGTNNEKSENNNDNSYNEDYSYLFKINTYINPMETNNILDIIDNPSINSTNENKVKEFFNFELPFIKQEVREHPLKKQKIFEIIKMNKKIGRIKKNSIYKGKHDKLSEDNIIRKIKRRFHEKLRLYINEQYRNYCLKNKYLKSTDNWLKKISPKISCQIKKKDNLKWFKSKIFEIFSENISSKYTAHPLNSNKLKIKNLLSLNDDNKIKKILNSTVEVLFDKYINNEKIDGFQTLNDDIEELKSQMESSKEKDIKEYLIKYERIAKNMKNIFENKTDRKSE